MKYKVDGDFDINDNRKLTSLEGCPEEIIGDFCARELAITNLVGGPKRVEGNFYVNNCSKLVSLKGIPHFIGRRLGLQNCSSLHSLEGCPETLNGILLYGTPITSLEHFPKKINGNIAIEHGIFAFTEKQLREVCEFDKLVDETGYPIGSPGF
jgi:hypothetical protein